MAIQFQTRVLSARRFAADVLLSLLALFVVTLLPLLPSMDLLSVVRMEGIWTHTAIYSLAAVISVIACRTYRMIWRYATFNDLVTLIKASTLTVVLFAAMEVLFFGGIMAQVSGLLIYALFLIWIANIGVLSAPRFIARMINGPHVRKRRGKTIKSVPVLATGNLQRVEAFLRACRNDPDSHYAVVGVLADEPSLHGSYLDGVEVLGALKDVKQIVSLLKQSLSKDELPTTLVLAKDDASRGDFEKILRATSSTGLKVGRLPRHDALHNSSGFSVEPVALADLLGRPELVAEGATIADLIHGHRILVTGAGGSIGSELTRQIAALKPEKLIILDNSEFNLYTIDKEMAEKYPGIARETRLIDVRDGALVSRCIRETHPHVVLHAAALKHVPMVEDHPIEGMKTNVLGTINVAEACCAHGVRAMVTISTDKAVNPCNVMGATKRLAEAYCQGLDQFNDNSASTRFITVRFGNVLGSAGSVVPLFQRQIEAGGPVTVTHPDITRYFMTIPEAVSLVLQAGGQGVDMHDERGSIYVLDMGEPVKIIDLARQMITLSGGVPDVDIKIEIVGLRPGEKLYEEVAYSDEVALYTRCKSIMRLKPRATDLRILQQQVQEMRNACVSSDREKALRMLQVSVPDYAAPRAPAATPVQRAESEN